MEITVKKLTPDLMDTYFNFFDHVAFTDNPRWASCYCYFYSNPWQEGEWDLRTAQDNRRDSRAWMEAGGLNGYLAFVDDKPVGWCHANDMKNLKALTDWASTEGHPPTTDRTACIICYIVAPDYRGQGVATELLKAACTGLEQEGFDRVIAYPSKSGETVQDHYHGPLAMYHKQGFVQTGELGSMLVVQKELG
jgi:RimJ/RimL family protein N-acetyltransferase